MLCAAEVPQAARVMRMYFCVLNAMPILLASARALKER
jgi:hypothetical protein